VAECPARSLPDSISIRPGQPVNRLDAAGKRVEEAFSAAVKKWRTIPVCPLRDSSESGHGQRHGHFVRLEASHSSRTDIRAAGQVHEPSRAPLSAVAAIVAAESPAG
jgi:hypothetical protein